MDDDYRDEQDERQYRPSRQNYRGAPPPRRPSSRNYPPPRRDNFPIIIGAVVGALIVGLFIALYLLLTRNTSPPLQSASTNNPGVSQTAPAGSESFDQSTAVTMDRTVVPGETPPGLQTMAAIRPATGLGTPMPDEGNTHVGDGEPITYKNYPPSSGTHYNSPSDAGFYDTTLAEGNFVHSLEHGYIVLYYKPDIPAATKQQLKDLMTQLPNGKYGKVKLVIVPYTNMSTPLAIAAWDRLLLLKSFNADEVKTFYQQWVDKGPEDVP
jgi:hypothetical protein